MAALTLYELNSMVRDVVELGMPGSYWVEAELSEVRERSGHCYMELVQKDLTGNSTVARASARCWRSTWASVRPGFEQVTGEHFRAGLKVLLQVHAQFHENFGFSWIVTDIDPAYTLGDMARRRQEIIRILKEEGVFDLNKELCLSLFASRIAVVSSESAAGYGDFCNQLDTNAYGFAFSVRLFPAVMQGERTEGSIISALDAINSEADDFDCVVIIRGGGAVSDLSAFDSLALAENVANFPLPVITGIGHERDESVLDMVANKRVKTPTAAAALLIENLKHTYDRIVQAQERISVSVSRRMDYERVRLERVSGRIPVLFSLVKTRQQARIDSFFARVGAAAGRIVAEERLRLDRLSVALAPAVRQRLSAENHRLELLGQRISAVDPAILLRRGYSITLHNGRAVYSPGQLSDGDVIETRLAEGNVRSVVRNKDN
ncbi:exodeoxyribonuclease VII large subunit [Marseilla massiliensis]|uniref:Exodeoxyribonuclease 7 large subunit n=1 Tax=Marseilla massiliensis TaxID=1841864 RepID=A0A939B6Y4_9BACT|nr:exodeoxyribonuclease VII large subunit [Marseilla massiliensis]MBM6673017.1 exodeoxyribonuclease VII large subunit [Marseilla massiliensis]